MTSTKKKHKLWDDSIYNKLTDISVKCKCGHTMLIINKKGRMICKHCQNMVFVNKKLETEYRKNEFKKRLRRKLNE